MWQERSHRAEEKPVQRKFFDVLVSAGGLVMVVVLVVAGGLLMWGYSFTTSNVHDRLAQQDITFPSTAAFSQAKAGTEITPSMRPYLLKYAGEQLTTGAQAEAYANHFIAVHLSEMPYGGVYATVSAAARANPTDTALGDRGPGVVPRHDPAGAAPRGVRLLGVRSDRPVGSDRRLRPRPG